MEEEGEELLWSVQELSAVRGSGLVGALVGCLPRAPRQNTRLGRPLLLRAEESQVIREELQQTREEHLQTREELQQTREELQQTREEHLQTREELQQTREEHLQTREELQQTREEHLQTREEHLQTREELQQTREEHLQLQSGEHLQLHPHTDQSQPRPTETPNSLTEPSADAHSEELHPHTEESEGGAPGGPSDGQQGAVGPALRSEDELTEAQELQWEEFLSRSLEEQHQRSLDDRKSALTSSLSDRVSEAELASRLSSLEQSFLFPRSALTVQLSTCRQGLPLQPIRSQDLPLEPIRSEQQSPEPMGVRLQVFRDLRRRGFYLTSGGKFGVDFLVYPGDPLRFHAHFMALCLPVGGSMSVAELLSCVRLSSNVKKTLLLCSVCPPGGVLYSSLQWSHMS